MKKIIYKIIVVILVFSVMHDCFSQQTYGNGYDVKQLFTGVVKDTLDSVFIDVCIIKKSDLTGTDTLAITYQNGNRLISADYGTNINDDSYISINGDYVIIPIGYTDPYNMALEINAGFKPVNMKKLSGLWDSEINGTIISQLVNILNAK